jgi:hypothetical protein
LRLAPFGDVARERRFDTFAVLDLGVKDFVGLLKFRLSSLNFFLEIVMGAPQIRLGATTGCDVLASGGSNHADARS